MPISVKIVLDSIAIVVVCYGLITWHLQNQKNVEKEISNALVEDAWKDILAQEEAAKNKDISL